MPDGKDSVLERMAFTAADLKRQVTADATPDPFKMQILDRLDAGFRARWAEALDIRARRAERNDADSRAIVAYLDGLLDGACSKPEPS